MRYCGGANERAWERGSPRLRGSQAGLIGRHRGLAFSKEPHPHPVLPPEGEGVADKDISMDAREISLSSTRTNDRLIERSAPLFGFESDRHEALLTAVGESYRLPA